MGEARMNTQALIARLAQDPVPLAPPRRHQALRVALAWLASALLLLSAWGLNPALHEMAAQPAFQLKLLWLAAVVGWSAQALQRLARPGVAAGRGFAALGGLMLAMLALGLAQTLQASPASRSALWWGSSWQGCMLSVLVLALPLLGALLWALRQEAPTRLAWAGAAAGLLAGALASGLYSLHCTETGLGFIAAWYGAALLLAAGLGAWLGPRLLRW